MPRSIGFMPDFDEVSNSYVGNFSTRLTRSWCANREVLLWRTYKRADVGLGISVDIRVDQD
jgi:hypothetical protein